MGNKGIFNMRNGWLAGILGLILCLVLVLSVVGVAVTGSASADEEGLIYPIMHPDRETREEWIEAYNTAPRAYIEMEGFQVPSPRGSLSLLDHLDYIPVERNQGYCGNCWVWAGTGCLEVALDVQEGTKDRLSVQYVNSCGGGGYACCGGWLSDLADFYTSTSRAIPWSNTNASWQDSGKICADGASDVSCGSISIVPDYPITSITDETIVTQPVDQATAIANIKNVLNQNRAIWFGFWLPTDAAWSDFLSFWNTSGESVVYDMDKFCGVPDEDAGGHAVLCVGYNDDNPANEYWVMLNSWGTAGGNRPNGLFRINMDMNYQCVNDPYYSFYWQTLDVTFDIAEQPDITVSPTSFEKTLAPDTTQDYILDIGNVGNLALTYTISDVETTGMTATAGSEKLLSQSASVVMEVPVEETGGVGNGWQNIMTEDFEGDFPGTKWVDFFRGVVTCTPQWVKDDHSCHGGSYSAWYERGTTPGNGGIAYGPFDLSDASDAELNFYYFYDLQECSDPYGEALCFGWGASVGASFYTAPYYFGEEYCSPADSGGWQYESFDLTNVPGVGDLCGQSQVWIWFWAGNGCCYADTGQGAFIDDVVLRKYTAGAPVDCPWLDEDPKCGSVPAGCPADSITVSIDTTGLTEGDYHANIVIVNNDPDEDPTIVPVSLHVSSANNPPNIPTDPSPADDATGVPINADLSWTGGDPDVGDTVTYDVYFGTSVSPPLVSNDQSATTYDPGTLSYNTGYYWKIVATDNHAASTTGPVWDFTTGSAGGPQANRTLPDSAVVENEQFEVGIDISGAQFGQVVETLPENFDFVTTDTVDVECEVVSGMSEGGVTGEIIGDREAKFTFFASSAVASSFKYFVTAPGSPVEGAAFSGVLRLGPEEEYAVGGDTIVDVGTGGWDPWVYDTDPEDGYIEINELLHAISDYIGGNITISQLLNVISLYITHTPRP